MIRKFYNIIYSIIDAFVRFHSSIHFWLCIFALAKQFSLLSSALW